MTREDKKGLIFSGMILAAFASVIVIGMVNDSAEDCAEESIKKDLETSNDIYKKLSSDMQSARKTLDDAQTLRETETAKVENGVEAWKKRTGYSEKVSKIQNNAAIKIKEFKSAIGFDNELAKIKTELDEGILEVKESMNFDKKVADQKKLISDANKVYNTQVMFMENNTASDAAKKAARRSRDSIIDSANESIEELNKALKKETKALTKEAKNKEAELNERVRVKAAELNNEAEAKMTPLLNDLAEARNDIRAEVIDARSEAQVALLDAASTADEVWKSSREKMQQLILTSLSELTFEDKIALFLKANKVPPVVVVGVGACAGIPIFAATAIYISTISKIVKKM